MLAAVGIFGVLSHSASHENGICIAFGAPGSREEVGCPHPPTNRAAWRFRCAQCKPLPFW